MGFLSNLFKSSSEKQMIKLKNIADEIDALASKYSAMSDDELKNCTEDFKKRYIAGESLDDLLPEAFAVTREASGRVLGMRHFYVQLLGGIVLHQGRIAQMGTGEGKTLVATLPAYLNALTGNGMHIVTVNDYLAKRDAEWMGKIYKFLGLTVGVVIAGMEHSDKQDAYNCDIIYATNNELGFDYLRDNMIIHKEEKLQRGLIFALIDEVDSILIDEARTPLIISGMGGKSSDLYVQANRFAKTLLDTDYIIEEKEKTVRLTEEGVEKAERYFKLENYADVENQDLVHFVGNALKAHKIMFCDKDYGVVDGEIIIIDEFTGRPMIGRRYSEGLHQAIEAKENVRVQSESKTLATITFQNYFRLYKKLSGMTGTAKTEESEFMDIYKLDVIVLPTNMPIMRIDENDRLYSSTDGKMRAIIKDIKEHYEIGQPMLVGTATVEKSEELSKLLVKEKIPHNVLNAKNHQREAEIISQAGKFKSVTIATNMAGRGTDIMLGGNPEFLAKEKLFNLGYTESVIAEATSFATITDELVLKAKQEYEKYYKLFKIDTDIEHTKVIEIGGLRVIGTVRHDSRRIDNQLRGRTGRQGDPGASVFYLSMEDELVRVFGGDTMKSVADKYNFDADQPIELKIITNQIEKAQKRIEGRNFSIRKQVLSYDDVMNVQRGIIYGERHKVLEGESISDNIDKMIADEVQKIVNLHADENVDYREWNIDAFNIALERVLPSDIKCVNEEVCALRSPAKIGQLVLDEVMTHYVKKIEDARENGIDWKEVERVILLKNVDSKWMDHIDNMHHLKQGIGLVAYGQRDPVVAYRMEGFDMFEEMIDGIQRDTVAVLCTSHIERQVERKKMSEETSTNDKVETIRKEKKVGRNDVCPCGSGKKYKNCCGM